MKLIHAVIGCMLFTVTDIANAGLDAGLEAVQRGDYKTAMAEWRPLAEQGDVTAQFNIGLMYHKGQGVLQDFKEAAKWFRKAAEQDDVRAQRSLGSMYSNGQGVQQDYKEAVKWFRKAAEQGDAGSQFMLGWMYEQGKGVPQDYNESVKWLRLATDQGQVDAQLYLATHYYLGEGVQQSSIVAYALANHLAPTGEEYAIKFRDDIAKELNFEDIEIAQELTRNFKDHPISEVDKYLNENSLNKYSAQQKSINKNKKSEIIEISGLDEVDIFHLFLIHDCMDIYRGEGASIRLNWATNEFNRKHKELESKFNKETLDYQRREMLLRKEKFDAEDGKGDSLTEQCERLFLRREYIWGAG